MKYIFSFLLVMAIGLSLQGVDVATGNVANYESADHAAVGCQDNLSAITIAYCDCPEALDVAIDKRNSSPVSSLADYAESVFVKKQINNWSSNWVLCMTEESKLHSKNKHAYTGCRIKAVPNKS
jgi:hypothetical protein